MIGFYMPCGCKPDLSFCGWKHKLRYTKLRYWWRVLKMSMMFHTAHMGVWILVKFCMHMSEMHPSFLMVFGGFGMSDANGIRRIWENEADKLTNLLKEFLFLGADSDHPDGMYAQKPSDLVDMTNDEWEHWFKDDEA